MNKQEAYNKVRNHLLIQNAKSFYRSDQSYCAYRGVGGRKCAIGILIPDELYNPEMEMRRPEHYCFSYFFEKGGIWENLSEDFLLNLQRIHDDYSIERWPDELNLFAARYGLNPNG